MNPCVGISAYCYTLPYNVVGLHPARELTYDDEERRKFRQHVFGEKPQRKVVPMFFFTPLSLTKILNEMSGRAGPTGTTLTRLNEKQKTK